MAWPGPGLLWLLLLASPATVTASEHIRGSCLVGASEAAHGLTDAQAVEQIRSDAQLYATRFEQFRKTERDVRKSINELLELKQWTQADIVAFTQLQRRLLFLSVGSQLATGRTTVDELPGYAATIRGKITDIEIELGCDFPADG